MSYNHWFPGEPNNVGFEGEPENCISIRELGNTNPWVDSFGIQIGGGKLPFVPGWIDRNCATEIQYICQKNCDDDGLFGCVFGAGVVPQSNIFVLLAIFILLLN